MSIFVGILHFQPGMTPQDILNAAKQGNPQAIAALMNRSLQPKGITARARLVDGTLQVLLEGETAPSKAESAGYVEKVIKCGLAFPANISHLVIAGKAIGAEKLEWTERIEFPRQQAIQAPKIPTIQKKENPKSMPGRPASGLKYQAPSPTIQKTRNQWGQTVKADLDRILLGKFDRIESLSMLLACVKKLMTFFRWAGLGFLGFVVLAVVLQALGITKAPDSTPSASTPSVMPVASPLPAASPPPAATCVSAGGRIWSEIKIYTDKDCTKLLGTVLGIGKTPDGQRMVKIKYDSGPQDWKQRDAVRDQAFVKSDDPALTRLGTVMLDYPN